MKNIISIIFILIVLLTSGLAIYMATSTNTGQIASVSICIIIMFLCCFGIYVIAHDNDEEEKNIQKKKEGIKQHINFCLAMEKARKD